MYYVLLDTRTAFAARKLWPTAVQTYLIILYHGNGNPAPRAYNIHCIINVMVTRLRRQSIYDTFLEAATYFLFIVSYFHKE